jgi:hypothetical protein
VTFRVIEAEQRSEAWFQARLGRLTGSCAGDMLAKIKTGEAAARRDLRMQLVVERLTGKPQEEGFISPAMQRGIDLEAAAIAAYEGATGNLVRSTGFLACDELLAGCSLDGDVDNFTGILECKCPKSATHLGYLRGQAVPAEHRAQMLHNCWISSAQWCDFASFDNRFPAELQLFVVRYTPTALELTDYEMAARTFLAEVDRELESVKGLMGHA